MTDSEKVVYAISKLCQTRYGFPPRLANALSWAGMIQGTGELNQEKALEAVASRKITQIRNIGIDGENRLRLTLGLPVRKKGVVICPHCGKYFDYPWKKI